MAQNAGSSPLFAVFFLAVYSLFLIPYTIYKGCVAASPEDVVRPWEAKKETAGSRFIKRFFTVQNVLLGAGWLFWLALLVYVQTQTADLAPFDPYEILKLERGATDREVKKAFRQLSLIYHPDKNPDPAAAVYFRDSISKAYKALTDDVARENYEKYGHPDGPQALNLGVALPEWIFSQDKRAAPVILISLVGLCILLPLVGAACYLLRTNKFQGPNGVNQETLRIFAWSKFAVKELQGLSRVLDTLVYACEFIQLPTPGEQAEALEALRRTCLRLHPDLKEKPTWWKRKPSIVKVNMLLLAHLAREEIPPVLQADLKFVLKKSPVLLEEMITIANLPRTMPYKGWLTPTQGCMEFGQCLTQALSIAARKQLGQGGGKGGADLSMLLQLPHVDHEVVKRMTRKKVRGLAELAQLPLEERLDVFVSSGLTSAQAEQAATSLGALPTVTIEDVTCSVDGEEAGTEIVLSDIITCSARVLLSRASHALPGAEVPKRGAVLAYAPLYPYPKEEKWLFVVGDPLTNNAYTRAEVSLLEAEQAGLAARRRHAQEKGPELVDLTASTAEAAASKKGVGQEGRGKGVPVLANGSATEAAVTNGESGEAAAPLGQRVELKFRAPFTGKWDLTLYCLSDSWAGVDRAVPFKLRVAEQSRAEREGRGAKSGKAAAAEGGSDAEDGEERDPDEEDEEEEDEGDWDSEDTGTEESGSEDEAEPAAAADKGGNKKGASGAKPAEAAAAKDAAAAAATPMAGKAEEEKGADADAAAGTELGMPASTT